MKTTEEKNQIEAQKETIESLNRKVESLEKELQKCLDPDSGEFKFQKPERTETNVPDSEQDNKSKIVLYESVYDSLKLACAASFIPVWEDDPKDEKKRFFVSKHDQWKRLADEAMTGDDYKNLWSDDSFRMAMRAVNEIVDALAVQTVPHLGEKAYIEAAEKAAGGCITFRPDTHKGFLMLKSVLEKKKNAGGRLGYREHWLDDTLVTLGIITHCQSVLINAIDEPIEEEEEKND